MITDDDWIKRAWPDWARRQARPKVIVEFNNVESTTEEALDETKRFREQIKALGVARRDFDYFNYDAPPQYGPDRDRARQFVALTDHAEMIFLLVRPASS